MFLKSDFRLDQEKIVTNLYDLFNAWEGVNQ